MHMGENFEDLVTNPIPLHQYFPFDFNRKYPPCLTMKSIDLFLIKKIIIDLCGMGNVKNDFSVVDIMQNH